MNATSSGRDFGPRPELTWLPIAMLSVDPSYQRGMDTKRSRAAIDAIEGRFKWSCFGTVLVTAGNGDGWLIIDGQHRVEAARRLGIKTVPCIVAPDVTVAEQAEIFVSTNQTRVQVNPYALFHARVLAGDATAVAVARLLNEAHLEIPRYPVPRNRMEPRQTLALYALEKIIRGNNPAARGAVIALGHAYQDQAGAVTAALISAAVTAAEISPKDVDAIGAWFRRHDAADLNMRYRRQQDVVELAGKIVRSIEGAKQHEQQTDSRISPPARDRLMAGR